jgi:hypothetical protein
MQHRIVGCSVAQEGAAELKRVQRNSVRCNVLCRVQRSPVEKYTLLAAEFGPEGKHFVSENSRFFLGGGVAKLRCAGRAAPR